MNQKPLVDNLLLRVVFMPQFKIHEYKILIR